MTRTVTAKAVLSLTLFILGQTMIVVRFALCSKTKAFYSHRQSCQLFFRQSTIHNQNHQLNWWYAPALEGHITGAAPQGALKGLPTALLSQAAAKAACFYAFVFLLPVNGSIYSLREIWSAAISSVNWFLIYSAIAFLLRPTVST